MLLQIKKLLQIIKYFKDYFSGDFAYQQYLQHCHRDNCATKIISKKDFLNKKRNNKWRDINRCC